MPMYEISRLGMTERTLVVQPMWLESGQSLKRFKIVNYDSKGVENFLYSDST